MRLLRVLRPGGSPPCAYHIHARSGDTTISQTQLLQPNTGEVLGLQINQPAALFHIPIRADAWLYWLTLLVTVILFALDSCYPLLSILFMAREASGEIGYYGMMRFNGNTRELFGDLIGAN